MIGNVLLPASVLLTWTLVMWLWMMATRAPAMLAGGFDIFNHVGGNGADAAKLVPETVQWKADNYNHLMEQPTVFYAAALVIALDGEVSQLSVQLAWGYVGLRIAHSLVQSLSNRILYRFSLFAISTFVLAGLVAQAVIVTSR